MLRILLIAIFVVSPACKKVSDKSASDKSVPVSASRPVAKMGDLGDVVATLQLPSGTKSADLVKLIDNVQPGASAMMTAQMPMLLGQMIGVDLSSADLTGPVSILVLNPEKHPDPALLLVKSSKKDALVKAARDAGKEAKFRDGLVLIGTPSSIASAEAFAFANLAKPSKGLVGIVYPNPLVKAYQKRFDDFTAQMENMPGMSDQGPFLALIMKLYKEMFTALGEQSDRVEVTIGGEDGKSEIFLRLYAVPGTTFDSFISGQVPADHKLLARLPSDDASNVLFSGEMRAGAARDAIFEFSLRATAALYGEDVGGTMKTAMMDWLEAFDGSVAGTMGMHVEAGAAAPMVSMNYLMGSSDVDRMRKGWRQMMHVFADSIGNTPNMMGMKFDIEFKEKTSEYDGVEIDSYSTTFDPSTMDPEVAAAMPAGAMNQKMYIASFDKVAAMSMSTTGAPAIEAIISSARGKAKGFSASGRMAQAVEDSKKRQESMLMVFDMAELMKNAPQAMPFRFLSMGMGKEAGGALVWRMSISP